MCNQAEAPQNLLYHLTQPEINDPYIVLRNLFGDYHLPELQDTLWHLLKTAATGNFSHDLNMQERSTLFSFYEWIVKLLEAAYLLNETENGARKISEANR